jgi:serine/threonine protein kinase
MPKAEHIQASCGPCPSREALRTFGLGKSPTETFEAIAKHLIHCTQCEQAIRSLHEEPDVLVVALRKGRDPDPFDKQQQDEVVSLVEVIGQQVPEPLKSDLSHSKSHSLPTQIGEYEILGRMGVGGMGEVYQALHRRLRRHVAIKVLRPDLIRDSRAIKRFEREVQAAGKLTHPNVVATHDAGEHDGRHYLVMEYVTGSDLASVVKENGPMSVHQALDCIVQAARGLAHAHAEGIVHRDVKPSNLLLDTKGTVKVLDMGLARITDPLADPSAASGADLTRSGNIMGTIDYMAPEQAMDSRHADARSDIYGLGCTLYYLLNGRPPFSGDTVLKRVTAHQQAQIPHLPATRADVPPGMQAVFAKMVAKAPEARFQTILELLATLESLKTDLVASTTRGSDTLAISIANGMHVMGSPSLRNGCDMSHYIAKAWPKASLAVTLGCMLLGGVTTCFYLPSDHRSKDFRPIASQPPSVGLFLASQPGGESERTHPSVKEHVVLPGSVSTASDERLPQLITSATPSTALAADGQPPLPPRPVDGPVAVAPFSAQEARGYQLTWANICRAPIEFNSNYSPSR